MADASGLKRPTGVTPGEEPPSKRQATDGSVVQQERSTTLGPVTAELAAEMKRKVKEALAKRRQLLEAEFAHLEADGKLLDFASSAVRTPTTNASFVDAETCV